MFSKRLAALTLALLAPSAWGAFTPHWVCPTAQGAGDGTSLANCQAQASLVWGTSAGQVGRGDVLYLCGAFSSGFQIGGIGAFDGTANADSDILIISGDRGPDGSTGNCGDLGPGVISNPTTVVASGHGILGSGRPGFYVFDLRFDTIYNNAIYQLIGATGSCTATPGYYCFWAEGNTFSNTGSGGTGYSGHGAATGSSAFGNFPATPTTGVLLRNNYGSDMAGAVCIVSGHYDGAIIDNCDGDRVALTTDTWGVYQRPEARNIGTCGSGMTWTDVSGSGSQRVFRVLLTENSCIPTGATILRANHMGGATGIGLSGEYTVEPLCTGANLAAADTACAAQVGPGEIGQFQDYMYFNRGTSGMQSTASVQVLLAPNTNGIIQRSRITGVTAAHDGTGIGFDLMAESCTVRWNESERNAYYGYSTHISDCDVYSNIAVDNGDENYSLSQKSSAWNNTSIFTGATGTHFSVRAMTGFDREIYNNRLIGGHRALENKWDDGGIVTWNYNLHDDLEFTAEVGNPASPTTPQAAGANDVIYAASSVRPGAGDPARQAGTYLGRYRDYTGRRFHIPPSIGAYEAFDFARQPITREAISR